MRVLVVEDDELLAESLLLGLTADGYAVEVAGNGIDRVPAPRSRPSGASATN